ncbi:hypothetical protein MNBD_ALPHA06-1597 [hydrothermal vent metagenome]|uniref:Uncharacterized protein n=1 Tax=hydrothermal vent metagenome TaxID=652676 RepID=A0A3B0SWP1_9ZZZZ
MLSDRLFFPLLILVLGLIIYAAFKYGPSVSATQSPLSGDPMAGFLIEGADLRLIDSGPNLVRELINDPEEGYFVRSTAGAPLIKNPASAGIFLAMLPDIGMAWSGQTIHVAVELRQSAINPSSDVIVRYYAVGRGNGPVTPCAVSKQWQTCYMTYKVRLSDNPPNLSFVGIWPDTKGLGRYVDMRSMEIRINQPIKKPIQDQQIPDLSQDSATNN